MSLENFDAIEEGLHDPKKENRSGRVSNDDVKSDATRSRRPGLFVWLLAVGSCLLLAGSIYQFVWRDVRQHFEPSQVAARQQQRERADYRQGYRQQVDRMVALAIERVQTLGGQCQKREWKEEFYEIDLSHSQGTDADLALLLPFQLLAEDNRLNDPDRFFGLTLNSKTTNDSLAYVGDLTNIVTLKVSGSGVTDAGLFYLNRLDQLRVLDLSGTQVSDDSIDLLARWKELNRLDVSDTGITVAGIAGFLQENLRVTVVFSGGSARWRSVRLDENADQAVLRKIIDTGYFRSFDAVPHGFSDADLELVASQREVKRLDLSGSAVTDAGLRHLNGLASLESLSLTDTMITDEGLQYLLGMRSLRRLLLQGTRVSFAAAAQWQQKMPTVTIYHADGPLKAVEASEDKFSG
jgi:hypothetical protein